MSLMVTCTISRGDFDTIHKARCTDTDSSRGSTQYALHTISAEQPALAQMRDYTSGSRQPGPGAWLL